MPKTTWRSVVWGTRPSDGVFYLPVGFHHDSSRLGHFALVGGIYKAFFGMTFTNSYDDRTWSLGMQRDVYRLGRLRVGYGLGLMSGYHGRLAESPRLPLQGTLLFTHNVNPVVGLPFHLDLVRRVQFESFVTPVVTTLGVKIRFD